MVGSIPWYHNLFFFYGRRLRIGQKPEAMWWLIVVTFTWRNFLKFGACYHMDLFDTRHPNLDGQSWSIMVNHHVHFRHHFPHANSHFGWAKSPIFFHRSDVSASSDEGQIRDRLTRCHWAKPEWWLVPGIDTSYPLQSPSSSEYNQSYIRIIYIYIYCIYNKRNIYIYNYIYV